MGRALVGAAVGRAWGAPVLVGAGVGCAAPFLLATIHGSSQRPLKAGIQKLNYSMNSIQQESRTSSFCAGTTDDGGLGRLGTLGRLADWEDWQTGQTGLALVPLN